jgi:hypothetical protein
MPTFTELDALRANPEPAYPEYPAFLAQARQQSRFVNPAHLRDEEQVVAQRGYDWCTAVLGFHFTGLRRINSTEAELLLLADCAGIDPPLPARIVAWRAEDAARQADAQARREARSRADQERSDAALADCRVPVEVRPNTRGRRYRNPYYTGPLVHVVPLIDARTARRHHLAGRALCETAGRIKPRVLGDPTTDPATCVACLNYAPALDPECPSCGGALAWVDDQWCCRSCGDEFHDEQIRGEVGQ